MVVWVCLGVPERWNLHPIHIYILYIYFIYIKWIAMWRSCKSSFDMPSRCIWVPLWSYYPCAEAIIGSHKLRNLYTFISFFYGLYCLWILLFACLEENCIVILWIFDDLVRWDIPWTLFGGWLLRFKLRCLLFAPRVWWFIAWQVSFFETKAAFSGSSSAAIAPQMMAIASCVSLAPFFSPKKITGSGSCEG